VKTELLQDMYDLNQAFERVIAGLKRIETTTFAVPDSVLERRGQIVTSKSRPIGTSSISLTQLFRTKRHGRASSCASIRNEWGIARISMWRFSVVKPRARRKGSHLV
jgi:hypothetical protein